MVYKVYNENNVLVTVTVEQLENAIGQDGTELPVEIISAMSESIDPRFAPSLQEALYHEMQRVRITAIYGLLSLLDKRFIGLFREKEQSIPKDDLNQQISEKAILQAVIIFLENGVEGAKNAFFKGEIEPNIKSLLLFNYSSSNLPLTKKDIDFIISALEAYINKSEPWIQKTKKDDYEEDVIACLESFLRASETSTILCQLRDDVYEKLSSVCSEVLKMKIDPYAKEVIATFARALPPKHAYAMLEPIMGGRARGDIRKELEYSIEILRQKEQEMG